MNFKLKSYQYLIASSGVRLFSTIIITYIFSNFFSMKEFANYNLVVAISIIISGLSSSPQGFFLASNSNQKNLKDSSNENLNFIISISIVIFVLFYLLKNFFLTDNQLIFFFIIVGISLFLTIQVFFQNIYRIENNYREYFFVSTTERISLLIILIFSFLLNIEFIKILIFQTVICMIFFFKKIFERKIFSFNFKFYKNKKLVSEASYAFLSNFISILIGMQSLIIISNFFNEYVFTNVIAIAILFLSMATIPLGWIETIVGPIISRIVKTKNKKFLNGFIKMNFNNVLFVSFVFMIIILNISYISNFFELFFMQYANYKKITFLFCFLIPVMTSKIYLSWFFVCLKKTSLILYSNLFLLLFLILSFYLLNFNLENFIFFYVLLTLLQLIFMNLLFNYLNKLINLKDIYSIYCLTILNLVIYNFYYEKYYLILIINITYIFIHLKNNSLKKFIEIILMK